ncbi:polyprenyl synthetase family protein [Microbacterium sp. C7(2022)]|uniref:polyprenyl synthetase family protein n=1 Tax=Microbacterium sp. C7(2022) TaxID=2992759 RepID=UPI00237BB001|nr:polyprenyl synthetase family protein [Microbacterium sp. C7(2022)]MDE0545676.1 polyprenyl synthetase family protein [Microbacterium sp. C7(2022)]
MKALPPDPAIDDAVDTAVARILIRTSALGGSFAELGESIRRATMGGKRLRPTLVVAAFRALSDSEPAPVVYDIAAAFELLHAAFVVHDDVIDHDTLRRGIPNISGEFHNRARRVGVTEQSARSFGEAAAILGGDLLLHEATRIIMLANVAPEVREQLAMLLDDAVFISAAGELADVENGLMTAGADAKAVLEATFQKTAVYTFSAPLRAGAVLAGASRATVRALDSAAGDLGLAFQLVDDLIGAFGTATQAGKEVGADLREAKQTPLVAYAATTTTWPQVRDALTIAHTGPIAVRHAQAALAASGARDSVVAMVAESLASARETAVAGEMPPRLGSLLIRLADDIERRVP